MPVADRRTADRPGPTVAAPPPGPIENRIAIRTGRDIVRELRIRRHGRIPRGNHWPSLSNTWIGLTDPLRFLLSHYERYGPVFTVRSLHEPVVWAISPTANQQILVSEFDAFSWRRGRFRDLAPLLGDGMLNIDGDYHREMRKLLLPAFHREQVEASTTVMLEEAQGAADELEPGRIDVYGWVRDVALRIALRGLLGMRGDSDRAHRMAVAFGRALDLYGLPLPVQMLRGPGSPYAHAQGGRKALDELIFGELRERREAGDPGAGALGMLLAATDADGEELPEQAVRDQAVTLLFAGHDTTTATLTFLLYELGRSLDARDAVEAELDAVLGSEEPTVAHLGGSGLPVLERTISETIRRYPPAWVGPRRTVRPVTLDGVDVPAGIAVHYSSWATHHLPEYWEDPLAFRPDRFLPEAVAARPKGAYIPFGGGSRMCLGMRFGQYELRALAATLLRRFRFAPAASDTLRITTTPTLGPAGGLRFDVRRR
ncbi:MAG: cytochrome P450 [Patulibacter sp.]|nr:cytochrome P450 [Patulibacter sp.]